MQRSKWLRLTAVASAAALALTACGNGDTTDPDPDPGTSPGTEEPDDVDVVGRGDGQLVIASILDETGFLDYLSGPIFAGVRLAIEDINAAGGVLGQDVGLLEFDGGTDPAVAGPNVNSALAEGADVIVGAMASGVSQSFIDLLNANQVYQCSPSNTSPAFNNQESAAHYFRTVPPDEFVAPIIADEVVNDGNGDNVVIIARSDDYGVALADLVADELAAQNATVAETITYTDDSTFESESDAAVALNPSAVIIIAYREAGTLINNLVAKGVDPGTLYGSDGVFSSQLPSLVGGDADVIDGMKVIGASGTDDFNRRLADAGTADFLYGGQGYDCTILFALWAVAEGTDDTTQWDPQTLRDLTSGGNDCSSFADCVALLEAGEDINYDGASGPLALVEGNPGGPGAIGNPSFSVYAVAQFQNGGELTPVRSEEVDLR
jgi:ABC-type branched-subunit amino acid transport system substrate-binding protein